MNAHRKRLPDTRMAINHKFTIDAVDVFINVGLFEDGSPGELFLTVDHAGSTLGGFADAFSCAISYALQHDVPLSALVHKFRDVRFPPCGFVTGGVFREAASIPDYVFRWMELTFPSTPNSTTPIATHVLPA